MAAAGVAALLAEAHGDALRQLTEVLNFDAVGLTSAARRAKRQSIISSTLAKKLEKLDIAFAVSRHITRPKITQLSSELALQIASAAPDPTGDVDLFVNTDATDMLIDADLTEPVEPAPKRVRFSDFVEVIQDKMGGPIGPRALPADAWARLYERFRHGATLSLVDDALENIPFNHEVRERASRMGYNAEAIEHIYDTTLSLYQETFENARGLGISEELIHGVLRRKVLLRTMWYFTGWCVAKVQVTAIVDVMFPCEASCISAFKLL
eukprot:TRINITY_DN33962_c0_g3_i1.p1 TRINITY_DN33962_c0_g3~~TRINITY_DN33962_c0_g3_i1.p1  ORF type:complete len:267 (-),score=31.92 TRINITY_DN33962_c0_g3_i1:62-862(-)